MFIFLFYVFAISALQKYIKTFEYTLLYCVKKAKLYHFLRQDAF